MEAKKVATTIERAGTPTDPVFLTLVEHSKAIRTKLSIEALGQLRKKWGADTMSVGIHEDGNLYIGICAENRHYSVWYRPDGLTTIESYETTTDEFGEKTYTDIDRYDSRRGVTMANGITQEGGE